MSSFAPGPLAALLPEALVVVDAGGRLRWGNDAALRLFGVALEDGVGRHALEFVHPDDVEVVASALESIVGKAVGTYLEVRVRTAEGWRLVEVVGADLLHHPEVAGVVLCLRDLTERRRWEVARGDEARLRALVQHAATVIMLLDAEACVESASAAVTRLLGHDQEIVEGRPLTALVDEADRDRVGRELAEVAAGGGRRTIEASLVRRGAQAPVPFELHVVNLLDDPTVRGLVVSAHDVSELRSSLTQLAQAEVELARSERLAAVGQLASMIGHELRNPLTAVTNAHYLLRRELGPALTAGAEAHLLMAEREIERPATLAQDLLSYVRPRPPQRAPVDLAAVVTDVLGTTPPPEGVTVERVIEAITIDADKGHVVEMLSNLLLNAYQAMPDGGVVTVVATRRGADVVVSVRDEGGGVDPSVADSLFEPFVTTKTQGTGLGLPIVRRLAEAHGGTVALRSVPDGAVAELVLPTDPAAS
ncbi:MAG TPA: PAS domain S-box protein [Acidimicrobiales bacterium]|nr:PAS domain S-box protein [Acidimicrobiales bacterium]